MRIYVEIPELAIARVMDEETGDQAVMEAIVESYRINPERTLSALPTTGRCRCLGIDLGFDSYRISYERLKSGPAERLQLAPKRARPVLHDRLARLFDGSLADFREQVCAGLRQIGERMRRARGKEARAHVRILWSLVPIEGENRAVWPPGHCEPCWPFTRNRRDQ